jgi:hypothetical protein
MMFAMHDLFTQRETKTKNKVSLKANNSLRFSKYAVYYTGLLHTHYSNTKNSVGTSSGSVSKAKAGWFFIFRLSSSLIS